MNVKRVGAKIVHKAAELNEWGQAGAVCGGVAHNRLTRTAEAVNCKKCLAA